MTFQVDSVCHLHATTAGEERIAIGLHALMNLIRTTVYSCLGDHVAGNVMRMGFLVNPIAGMGGRVGLKGTDNVVKEAISRGAEPIAPKRAVEFLRKIKQNEDNANIEIITCPGIMGEVETKSAGFSANILKMKISEETTADDTKTAVKLLLRKGAELTVFVGGDGTAKDIFDVLRNRNSIPVLGVPAGVKMYSGVFAVSPADAAEVVLSFARKQVEMSEFEVVDADETAVRSDVFAVRLYGFLKAPFVPLRIQGTKQISPDTVDEKDNQIAIARFIVEQMSPDSAYILGPGTTVRHVGELLGIEKTLLGVDIYRNGEAALDVNEEQILRKVKDWQKAWLVLSPIGRQGILLGRGNQQISPEVVKHVGKEHIIVAATKSKLQSIEGGTLRVDSGNAEVDKMLKGYIRVNTDYGEWRLVRVR